MKIKAELEEISSGVYAFIQQRGEWFVSNSGLIVGEKFSVVVDSLANEIRAKFFIEKIEEVTKKPVMYLINTHGHPDHVWTNHMFNAKTICHENCREDTMNAFPEIYSSIFPDMDFRGAKITPQDITFEDRMRIHLDDKEIELRHVRKAHTTGDIYVYLPKEKVVFCGDLLFSKPCTPFAMFGSIFGSIEALKNLYNLDADFYVPGHGEVGGKEEILESLDYFYFVHDEAKKSLEKGLNLQEAINSVELGKYKDWYESERIAGNLAIAYSEIGEIHFDVLEITRMMFELAKKLNAGRYLKS